MQLGSGVSPPGKRGVLGHLPRKGIAGQRRTGLRRQRGEGPATPATHLNPESRVASSQLGQSAKSRNGPWVGNVKAWARTPAICRANGHEGECSERQRLRSTVPLFLLRVNSPAQPWNPPP